MPLLDKNRTRYGDPGYAAFVRNAYARVHGWPVSELRSKFDFRRGRRILE